MIRSRPMSAPLLHTISLKAHPQARNDGVRSIGVRVSRLHNGALTITYALDADLDRLRIPQSGPSRIGHRLWQHTCFEIFVRRKDLPAYYEFNFSPSGEWAAYAFERYRKAAALGHDESSPSIAVRSTATKLELDVAMHLGALSSQHTSHVLMLAISAVIEARDGSLSYWALEHPPGKPDFHHSDGFVLELDEIRD
jgi:hypothetical protein